jgi:hypothetical protein
MYINCDLYLYSGDLKVNSLLARPTGHHLLIKFEDPIQGAKNGSKNKILF